METDTFIGGALVAGGLLAAVIFCSVGSSDPLDEGSSESVQQDQHSESGEPGGIAGEGEACFLWRSGSTEAPIAEGEEALSDLEGAIASDDRETLESLMSDGKIFMVDENTKCRVKDLGVTSAKVEVLEGKFDGRIGWVAIEGVNKIPK
jgi:hypothetical protein